MSGGGRDPKTAEWSAEIVNLHPNAAKARDTEYAEKLRRAIDAAQRASVATVELSRTWAEFGEATAALRDLAPEDAAALLAVLQSKHGEE